MLSNAAISRAEQRKRRLRSHGGCYRMKAIRLTAIGSPLEEQEIAMPAVGARDVLIRIQAAGICHSDAHYRAGVSPVKPLPLTLGHEVAGVVEEVGSEVQGFTPGDRVCVHYLVTCGAMRLLPGAAPNSFARTAQMIGKHRDGGYAEFIVVPERSVFRLPDEIPFEQGAILMCSSATSLHALNKARLRAGETVAIFGVGGLGISALQLARHFGAARGLRRGHQSTQARARGTFRRDSGERCDRRSRRADSRTDAAAAGWMWRWNWSVCRSPCGRLCSRWRSWAAPRWSASRGRRFEVAPYSELLNKEAEIIGVSDHLASEIPLLLELARTGKLDLSHGIIRTVPLEAGAVNGALDRPRKIRRRRARRDHSVERRAGAKSDLPSGDGPSTLRRR